MEDYQYRVSRFLYKSIGVTHSKKSRVRNDIYHYDTHHVFLSFSAIMMFMATKKKKVSFHLQKMNERKKKEVKETVKKPLFFGEARKRDNFLKVYALCKKKCPIHIEKMLSWIEFETGISRINAMSMLMVIKDIDLIEIDELKKLVSINENASVKLGYLDSGGQ